MVISVQKASGRSGNKKLNLMQLFSIGRDAKSERIVY